MQSEGRIAPRRPIGVLALLRPRACSWVAPHGQSRRCRSHSRPRTAARGRRLAGRSAWKAVPGAEEYEFEIAADAGFNSPVLGAGKDDFRTKNTRATLTQTAPERDALVARAGDSRNGTPSAWSRGRSIKKSWASRTTLLPPVGGAQNHAYPATPLRLRLGAGCRRAEVPRLALATDLSLGSLITINGRARADRDRRRRCVTPPPRSHPGRTTGGHGARRRRGIAASPRLPGRSRGVAVRDDAARDRTRLGPLSCSTRVSAGIRCRARPATMVEINPRAGVRSRPRRFCCTGTTINTSLSPTAVFKNNTYYWRVRASTWTGMPASGTSGRVSRSPFDNVVTRRARWPARASRTCGCATTSPTPARISSQARRATRLTCPSSAGIPFPVRPATSCRSLSWNGACAWGGLHIRQEDVGTRVDPAWEPRPPIR